MPGQSEATDLLDRQTLLTAADLAEFLRVPVGTLRQWRYLGTGPRPLRLGRQVRYEAAEVRRWLSEECYGPR
jgi:predicted DNA-binding transcriptional regulator AlpA